jgi:hypothetical protein
VFIVDWVRECEKSSNSPEQPRKHPHLPADRRDAGEVGGARTICWFVGTQPYEPRDFGRTVGQLVGHDLKFRRKRLPPMCRVTGVSNTIQHLTASKSLA